MQLMSILIEKFYEIHIHKDVLKEIRQLYSCISNAVFANIEVIKETKYFGVFITITENDNPISLSYKFYRVDIKM